MLLMLCDLWGDTHKTQRYMLSNYLFVLNGCVSVAVVYTHFAIAVALSTKDLIKCLWLITSKIEREPLQVRCTRLSTFFCCVSTAFAWRYKFSFIILMYLDGCYAVHMLTLKYMRVDMISIYFWAPLPFHSLSLCSRTISFIWFFSVFLARSVFFPTFSLSLLNCSPSLSSSIRKVSLICFFVLSNRYNWWPRAPPYHSRSGKI